MSAPTAGRELDAEIAVWEDSFVRRMITELRNSIIVTPGDMAHWAPIMLPVFRDYAAKMQQLRGSVPGGSPTLKQEK